MVVLRGVDDILILSLRISISLFSILGQPFVLGARDGVRESLARQKVVSVGTGTIYTFARGVCTRCSLREIEQQAKGKRAVEGAMWVS